jgi:DNA invertase Pin-like site-specific DNA recombinase
MRGAGSCGWRFWAYKKQIADRRGWEVVKEYHDAGISGAKGRDARSGLDEMLKDAQRRRFDVVMAWAIDCLYLDQQAIDTTTPAERLMFQVTGAFAEFERSMIRQRVRAGVKRAIEAGKRSAGRRSALTRKSESRLNYGPVRAFCSTPTRINATRSVPRLPFISTASLF